MTVTRNIRGLAAVIILLSAGNCFAQQVRVFDAGPGWFAFEGSTPKGERFCNMMRGMGEKQTFSVRASKLSTMIGFANPAFATNSQVPTRMEFIVTQKGSNKPLSFVGVAKELGVPGGGMLLTEGAANGPFLGVLKNGNALYVIARGTRVGPYALVGIERAITALQSCLSALP